MSEPSIEKSKVIKYLRSCKNEGHLGHLALIVLQELIKVWLKDEPYDRAHLMDGNADNYHELDNIILNVEDANVESDVQQQVVELCQRLLRYGS